MRSISISIMVLLISSAVWAQDITGQWNGILKVQGMQLRLVFNVSKSGDAYVSTMDSPDQKANGIPVTTTSFENLHVKFAIANPKIEYEGNLDKDSNIVGTFQQGPLSVPMTLSRKTVEKEQIVRPQEPVKPFPYYSEDVTFENSRDHIQLAGTLTIPKKEGVFPAVVLISGSGAQNRDEELMGHKPFLVLSDHLTRQGIAVLRVDDRGTFQSQGDFKTATTADFATDVEAAVKYLESRKEIDKRAIGLLGHSEGGIIAPMVAAKLKEVAFVVLLAGTGVPGGQVIWMQQELLARASGASESDIEMAKSVNKAVFDIIAQGQNPQTLTTNLTSYLEKAVKEHPGIKPSGLSDADFVKLQVSQLASPWMIFFINYDPAPELAKLSCPVLAINGSRDLQVPARENLTAIKAALEKGGNKNVTTKELPDLNHLFQECKTGSPNEYAQIEQTMSPLALNEVSQWILKQVGDFRERRQR